MIDQAGVGAALVDSVRAEVARRALSDLLVCGVVFVSGDADLINGSPGNGKMVISTLACMTRLRFLMDHRLLRFPDGEGSKALLKELRSFEFEVNAAGRLSFGAAGAKHDDRVFSLALAVFPTEQQAVRYLPNPFDTIVK